MNTAKVRKRLLPVVSFLLTGLALWFVGRQVWSRRTDLREALTGAELLPLLIGVVLAIFAMTWIAAVWKWVLGQLGATVSYADTVPAYYVGELGKYIPGGLWPILGRGELLRRRGVARHVAYPSVFLSLGLLYISAAVVSAVAMPLVGVVGRSSPLLYLGVVGAAIAGTGALHPRVLAVVRSRVSISRLDDLQVLSWRAVWELVLAYVPTWLAVGLSTSAIAVAVSDDVNVAHVAVAAIVSWLVGFLIFPVPGGIGVRESVFIALAGLADVEGLAVALIARFAFVAVDVGGFALALLVGRVRR